MKKEKILLVLIVAILFFSVSSSAVLADTNEVLINEFVAEPQTNWDGSGGVGASDEWIEFYNPATSSVNIDNWFLVMIDANNASQILSGTIPAGGYFIIQNPSGSLDTNGRIELYDETNTLIDSVTYGTYNDGDVLDNAPDGNSNTIFSECLARYPNGIDTGSDLNDFTKTLCTYQSRNNVTFTPVNITDFPAEPSCALETDNIVVKADIFGSIAQVTLSLNTDGTWTSIVLPGTSEGQYTYTIPASQTIGNTLTEWQFSVLDATGNITFGQISSLQINSITNLQIFPPEPTGLNGWYTLEPQFELSSPSAAQILYRWDGEYFAYTAPFGLEGTPNDGNTTGGTYMLYYHSDVCSEQERQFLGRFDFKNPEIKDLYPTPGSLIFNEPPTTISAYLDEVYQGNSGINISSVIMEIDGAAVQSSINKSGALDAIVAFKGNLTDGEHEVMVYAEDLAGRTSLLSWNFELTTPTVFSMNINNPEERIYMDKRIPFNITLSREAEEISYINENDPHPQYKRLCRNCEEFGFNKSRFKSLREGENTVTFQAVDGIDVIEQTLSLVIDSKDPQIKKTEPQSGLASGEFTIEFDEENPLSLKINYGNSELGFDESEFNISAECQKDRTYLCTKNLDLSRFDGTEIEYYVTLEDIAGNTDESRPRTLNVDIAGPVINAFDFQVEGKYATFSLDINEPYLDEVVYKDLLEENPKEKRLCKTLQNGICQKKISFREGDHKVIVIARDAAGNEAEAQAN
ncbi:MAG: lamin tail domain-containing protein, partial [Nanoarchaeota archaeon]|nr:lamin tail domain-containing protein [Nanoarchaeota archaeon]